MTQRFPQFAFIAGELDVPFHGRTDLNKYDLGVARADNFYVDFRGGLKTAPGTAYVDTLEAGARIFSFPVSAQGDCAVLVFLPLKLHIYYGGAREESGGSPISLTTPYTAADLPSLNYHYKNYRAVITTTAHAPREVTYDAGTWAFASVGIGDAPAAPTNLAVTTYKDGTGSSTGDGKTVFVVTALDADGNESLGSIPQIFSSLFNYTAEAGNAEISWDPVADAVAYNVYRSSVVENAPLTRAQDVGYIGQSKAPSFVDANVIPDYTKQPPLRFNPFAVGSIIRFNVTSAGSGYDENATVIVGTGTGFHGYPIIVGGELVSIVVLNGGTGYTLGSTVTISGGGGTGATATVAEVSPASGLWPAASLVAQQRRLYAGQENAPLVIYGSRYTSESNFDYSTVPTADDGYVLQLDAESSTPISHLLRVRDNVMIFHAEGIDVLKAAEGRAISAVNFAFENQTEVGVSQMAPVRIGQDIIYATRSGRSLVSLNYTFYTNSFAPQDISILSPHLFAEGLEPVRAEWIAEPDKLLWVLRADGSLAVLTYHREQEIFGWATRRTAGMIRDIVRVREFGVEYLYLVVERDGEFFLEQMQKRMANPAEEYWGVDCGLRFEGAHIAGPVKITESSGSVFVDRPSGSFGSVVGHVLRAGGGAYEVLEVVSSTRVRVAPRDAAFRFLPDGVTTRGAYWTLTEPTDEITGLDHLDGKTVAVLADGDYLGEFVVASGTLTFDKAYSLITVGLPYECNVETLPVAQPEYGTDGKQKRIIGSAVRLYETRGLEMGDRQLWEIKTPMPTNWGEATPLESENLLILHESHWRLDAKLRFRQRYPLPATVLGLVTEVELSD